MSPAQYFGGRANEVELDARNAGTRRSEHQTRAEREQLQGELMWGGPT